MSWIEQIGYEAATGRLRTIYDRIRGPRGELDNILTVHSLRPHTLEGHMALYKNVLHHTANVLPTWWLEVIGVYVSFLNRCAYCVDHHAAGLARLLSDEPRAWQWNCGGSVHEEDRTTRGERSADRCAVRLPD